MFEVHLRDKSLPLKTLNPTKKSPIGCMVKSQKRGFKDVCIESNQFRARAKKVNLGPALETLCWCAISDRNPDYTLRGVQDQP